jgi:DNA-binding transcriptional LysR family regulator
MNLSTFDLNLLRVLDALLREGSTVRAAAVLHLSQPAVSAALARLRHATGDPLFVRQGTGLVPTDFARGLAVPLHEILERIEAVMTAGAFDPSTSEQVFHLATSDFFAEVLVPGLVARMQQVAPGMRLHVLDLKPDDYVGTLERREIDFAIFPIEAAPDWLVARQICLSHYPVVARRGHPRLARAGVAPGGVIPVDLYCDLGHALFSSAGSFTALGDAALARIGRQRRVVLSVASFYGVARAVSGSDLIALLPHHFAEAMRGPMGLELYLPPMEVPLTPVSLIWHVRSDAAPSHRWMRQLILDLGAELLA